MEREDLIGKTAEEMRRLMAAWGQPPFRGGQLYRHLYRRQCFDLAGMTDLAKPFRDELAARASIALPRVLSRDRDADGCEKFLLELADGARVEAVYIPEADRRTLCLSTQVGCQMGCGFCATAGLHFRRNLTAGEILAQYFVISTAHALAGQPVNLVFMGMGEPLLNFESVMRAYRLFHDPSAIALSRRGITLSTCGLPDGIRRLAAEADRPKLAVSLNAADDATRDRLMPVNRTHPLADLLRACREFPLPRGERITFEYILIDGINDSLADARRLAALLRPIRCKINLIPYNPVPSLPYRPAPERRTLAFQKILTDAHYTAMLRKSRGSDIAAACGQLAAGGSCPGAAATDSQAEGGP
jgi:23S rRNA (adenine2503-C2)-methyltransferase